MTFKVPPLQRNIQITKDDLPSDSYQIWWQSFIEALKAVIDEQQQDIANIQSALDAANIAQTSAVNANKATARINSYTTPTNVLSSIDGGSSASIVVADHTRVYPTSGDFSIPPVGVVGATITGLLYGTTYFVYYDDPTLSVSHPSFQTTTSSTTAQVGAGNARHFVGVVTTATSGGAGTTGGGGTPPGGGGGPIP